MNDFHGKSNLAYWIAYNAHEGQLYAEHDYFTYHVLSIAQEFIHPHGYVKTTDYQAYIVALLHDVVEDSNVSMQTILNLFGRDISDAVWRITHWDKVDYLTQYIPAVATNRLATLVKIKDLEFNLNQPTEPPGDKKQLYREAHTYLKKIWEEQYG